MPWGAAARAQGGPQRTSLLKVKMEATPERPEIPGAPSWTGTEQMWLLLCGAGLSSRMHKGKDLTQDHAPLPFPSLPHEHTPSFSISQQTTAISAERPTASEIVS